MFGLVFDILFTMCTGLYLLYDGITRTITSRHISVSIFTYACMHTFVCAVILEFERDRYKTQITSGAK